MRSPPHFFPMKINKTFIITITASILFILLAFFGLYQQLSTVQALSLEIQDEKIELERQKQQNMDLNSVTRQYQEIQENASKLDEAFISKDTISILQFIEDIESLSNSIALEEQLTVTPLPQSDDDPILTSEVLLTLQGSFPNIYRFLEAIEQKSFYITFSDMDITKSLETSYRATLKGSIHWK